MQRILLSVLFVVSSFLGHAQMPQVLHHWWRTDGNVNALAMDEDNGTVYIGGEFRYVGPPQNYLSVLDATTGVPAGNVAHPDRRVLCSAPDGQGGWFIGGDFTEVGGFMRSRLAHLNAEGQVTAWAPTATGTVTKMSREGNTLYVAGDFTQLNATPRNKFGALDASTAGLLPWSPSVTNGSVSPTAIMAHNGAVYIAGFFSEVNGEPRNNLAAVDGVTGETLPWDPDPTGFVSCMEAWADTVLVSGFFTQIGGQARENIAAIDATTGMATTWSPAVSGSANDMLISDGTVYLAGGITQVGGQPRSSFAQVDLATGLPTAWAPRVTAGNTAYALAKVGNTIYLGGGFTGIDGQDRLRLAAVDAVTGALTPWSPGANELVTELGPIGGQVFVGGQFTSTGGVPRSGLAALDLATGAATNWAPRMPLYSTVYALEVSSNIVHVGGVFDSLGLAPRRNVGAVDGTSALATPWAPEANGVVQSLVLHNEQIYAGGIFDSIGGQPQAHVAALDMTTGACTSWVPDVNGAVRAFAFAGDTVFIGGAFTTVNGDPHNKLAALHIGTGDDWTWDAGFPAQNTEVIALLLRDDVLYIGGLFSTVSGLVRGGLAAVQRSTSDLLEWDPSASGQGWCLLNTNSSVIAGGDFVPYETQPFDRNLAAFDPNSGALNDWSMDIGNRITAMEGGTQVTCIAGMSVNSIIDGEPVRYFAALALPISTSLQPLAQRGIAPLAPAPNPTTGLLHLGTALPDPAEVRVLDARGVEVIRTAYTPALDIAPLPNGVYTVVLVDGSGALMARSLVVKV